MIPDSSNHFCRPPMPSFEYGLLLLAVQLVVTIGFGWMCARKQANNKHSKAALKPPPSAESLSVQENRRNRQPVAASLSEKKKSKTPSKEPPKLGPKTGLTPPKRTSKKSKAKGSKDRQQMRQGSSESSTTNTSSEIDKKAMKSASKKSAKKSKSKQKPRRPKQKKEKVERKKIWLQRSKIEDQTQRGNAAKDTIDMNANYQSILDYFDDPNANKPNSTSEEQQNIKKVSSVPDRPTPIHSLRQDPIPLPSAAILPPASPSKIPRPLLYPGDTSGSQMRSISIDKSVTDQPSIHFQPSPIAPQSSSSSMENQETDIYPLEVKNEFNAASVVGGTARFQPQSPPTSSSSDKAYQPIRPNCDIQPTNPNPIRGKSAAQHNNNNTTNQETKEKMENGAMNDKMVLPNHAGIDSGTDGGRESKDEKEVGGGGNKKNLSNNYESLNNISTVGIDSTLMNATINKTTKGSYGGSDENVHDGADAQPLGALVTRTKQQSAADNEADGDYITVHKPGDCEAVRIDQSMMMRPLLPADETADDRVPKWVQRTDEKEWKSNNNEHDDHAGLGELITSSGGGYDDNATDDGKPSHQPPQQEIFNESSTYVVPQDENSIIQALVATTSATASAVLNEDTSAGVSIKNHQQQQQLLLHDPLNSSTITTTTSSDSGSSITSTAAGKQQAQLHQQQHGIINPPESEKTTFNNTSTMTKTAAEPTTSEFALKSSTTSSFYNNNVPSSTIRTGKLLLNSSSENEQAQQEDQQQQQQQQQLQEKDNLIKNPFPPDEELQDEAASGK